jgi:hypothetical protein
VTLTVKGVPVLVKHVGVHRNGASQAYGQNTMRFYPSWRGAPPTGSESVNAGFARGTGIKAKRVQEISPSDALGGITGWTPGRAVASLTRWYDNARVKDYVRTYEWGGGFLRVIDEATVQSGIEAWSRWYTGHRPVINGSPVRDGITDLETAPGTITLGPVRWTITAPPGTRLRIVGGEGHRWVNDRWELFDVKADNDAARNAGGWLDVGEWTITFIGPSGRWHHHFTW